MTELKNCKIKIEKQAKAHCNFSPLVSLKIPGESSFTTCWDHPHSGHQSRPQLYIRFVLDGDASSASLQERLYFY